VYERGAVWTARLPDIGPKPVVIVSDRAVTLALHPIAARITSVERTRTIPTTVSLQPGEVTGLDRNSYVLCHDLTTLRDGDLVEQLGVVPTHRLLEIEDRLAFVFRIGEVGE
jgi:mRNA-degrading endonuclease toxin of MazEF toxin-antitoxin module